MKISTPRWLFGINAILFCFVGILQFWIYWDGISEWWRITGLDFDEVKDTPYQKIWTSGRVIPALLFLIAGIVNLACFIRRSRTAGGESIE
ncbi:MAG: hypothetical protein CMO55_00825 [Verrucomicrobiales bacterium]|nr:hypothetical protein [Verrucomicrobiales bacterium]